MRLSAMVDRSDEDIYLYLYMTVVRLHNGEKLPMLPGLVPPTKELSDTNSWEYSKTHDRATSRSRLALSYGVLGSLLGYCSLIFRSCLLL